MHDDLLSIGALARAGGLSVSALRFYDAAGVLRPAHVDAVTGYRRYTSAQIHTARLVASLRQAGLPVADLVAAFLAVRPAVSTADAPAWPGLAGVLLHLDATTLRLVGCDRHRLAVATLPVRRASGPDVRGLAPLALLDEIASAALPDDGPVVLGTDALEILGFRGEPLKAAYPDYEKLLLSSWSRSTTIATDDLVGSVENAGEVVAVRLDGGRVALAPPGAPDALGFSRTFLLDSVRAARAEHVAIALDDERSALSVSPADRPDDVHLVMPIRLHRSGT